MSNIKTKTDNYTPEHETALDKLTLSAKPDKAMQEMMGAIDDLRDIYLQETDALQQTDTKTFLALQEKKLVTADQYRQGVEQMIERKHEMKDVNPLLRKRLEEMQNDFTELASNNMNALKRMQRCSERLGNTIRNAAKDAAKKQRSTAYGETGAIDESSNRSLSMGVSETA